MATPTTSLSYTDFLRAIPPKSGLARIITELWIEV
jgi:hypothetical protein